MRPAQRQGEGPALRSLSLVVTGHLALTKRSSEGETGHPSFHLRIQNHQVRDKNAPVKEEEGGAAG